jgi:putative Mn2+ efflux pump MntP
MNNSIALTGSMVVLMSLAGIAAALFGTAMLVATPSPIHEIEAILGFLIATVALGCAGIIDAVQKLKEAPIVVEDRKDINWVADALAQDQIEITRLSNGAKKTAM